MNYLIDKNNNIPAYFQLYEMMKQDIINDFYPYGSKLPSKRTIAQETNVSVITVEHAISLLAEEGYLESRPRSGYFVIYRSRDFNRVIEESAVQNRKTEVREEGVPVSEIESYLQIKALSKKNEDSLARAEAMPEKSSEGSFGVEESLEKGDGSKGTRNIFPEKDDSFTARSEETAVRETESKYTRSANESASAFRRKPANEEMSFDLISKTMRRVILEYGERVMVRSGNEGCLELREEIRKYLARSLGIHVSSSQIVIGSGAEFLYFLIAGLFPNKRNFAIEDPSFQMITLAYEQSGKVLQRLPIRPDGIPTEVLRNLEADLLHVTPFHSYPTGATADVSKRNEYLHWAVKHNAYLVEDNYDSEYTVSRKQEETLFSMDPEHVIYLNTFSKTIASSIRVGYMILPEHLVDLYHEKYGQYSSTVPIFEQLVITELIASGTFERHINRVRRNRRKQMKKENSLDR